ncbi:MAG: class I SAM-dependent methyltransferase [Actinomycetota bacterium]
MPDSRRKRAVAAVYSRTAKRLYEPLVVHGGFKLFGGRLNELVLEQGRRAVASADGAPILDMPVGTAFFTLEVAPQHTGPIVGVDIAAGMVRQARAAAAAAGVGNIITLQGDAHRLPFPDASFGAVLCTNGLQVIPGLQPTLEELVRVVRPGGIVYTSVLTVPLSRLASASAKARMPTILRSGQDVAGEFSKAGFQVLGIKHERLATLIEARRPAE